MTVKLLLISIAFKKINKIDIGWKELIDIMSLTVNLIHSLDVLSSWLNNYTDISGNYTTRGTGLMDKLIYNIVSDVREYIDKNLRDKPLKTQLKKQLWPIVRNIAHSIDKIFTPIGIEFTTLNKIISNLKEGEFLERFQQI